MKTTREHSQTGNNSPFSFVFMFALDGMGSARRNSASLEQPSPICTRFWLHPRGQLLWEPIMAKISKPDANPVVAALLTWLVFGLGHWLINGQQRKWIMILVATLVGMVLCCLPGIVISILSIIDSYQTAVKLKAGKEIDENEYSNALLFKIVKLIHKDAVLVEG
jgi:hypothetical protein